VRLLVFGHYSHTGFGVVTEEIGGRLIKAGHDVRVMAVNHRGEPAQGPLAGRVWPTNLLGQFINEPNAAAIDGTLWPRLQTGDVWKPEAVLVIADMSGLLGYIGNSVNAWRTLPVYHYCPIEGDNLHPSWRDVWSLFQPVAMSLYGQRVISEHIGRPVPMIYHGVNADTFRPVSMSDPFVVNGKRLGTKEACKQHIGLDPYRNVILRSDRLVERKFYHAFVESMAQVLAKSPDTDVLIHCAPVDGNLDLTQEVLRLPVEFRKRFMVSNSHDTFRGLTTEELVVLINAADVYVSTTGGEGFGLNLAESLACEVPVVVTDWAAEGEVVGDGGIKIPVLRDIYNEPVRYHSGYGMDWGYPDGRAFVEPVLTLLNRPARRRALGAAGRQHVLRSFSWDTAASQFISLFENRADSESPLVESPTNLARVS
jgi:glycosyltransferase involved in cell wall biosynthesis